MNEAEWDYLNRKKRGEAEKMTKPIASAFGVKESERCHEVSENGGEAKR